MQKVGKWQQLKIDVKRNKVSYIMLTPYFVLFFIFTVLPVVASVVIGFTDFNMLELPHFVGWKNYIRFFPARMTLLYVRPYCLSSCECLSRCLDVLQTDQKLLNADIQFQFQLVAPVNVHTLYHTGNNHFLCRNAGCFIGGRPLQKVVVLLAPHLNLRIALGVVLLCLG